MTCGTYMLIFPQHFLQECHGNGATASLWAQFAVGCEMFLPVWKGFGQFDMSGDKFLDNSGVAGGQFHYFSSTVGSLYTLKGSYNLQLAIFAL